MTCIDAPLELDMTEIEHIVDQVQRSFRGDAWHGPCVLEALAGVDARRAGARPIPGAHTIWDLVLHLRATMDVLIGRAKGEIGAVDDAECWPSAADSSESAWQDLHRELRERHDMLVDAITRFDPTRLDRPLFPEGSPAFNNFLGHAQHNAYHAGQIILLKRLMST
jgi:uncharacterized damage-inducible protein DinB